MTILPMLKLFHAIFLFLKEMWLRDRTFRQFVRENLSFILVSVGFAVMTVLFVNLYIIVKDQESQIAVSEQSLTHAKQQLEDSQGQLKEAKDSSDWWKGQYEALRTQKPPEVKAPVQPKPTPDPVPSTRPPSTNFVDRWKRLHH